MISVERSAAFSIVASYLNFLNYVFMIKLRYGIWLSLSICEVRPRRYCTLILRTVTTKMKSSCGVIPDPSMYSIASIASASISLIVINPAVLHSVLDCIPCQRIFFSLTFSMGEQLLRQERIQDPHTYRRISQLYYFLTVQRGSRVHCDICTISGQIG